MTRRPRNDIRTIHFVALGCPKNRVDTEVMAGIAAERGLEVVPAPEGADAIVVGTCAFIEPAREESVRVLLEMARHRERGRCRLLVAAGCMAQRYGADLSGAMPEIDRMLGTARPDGLAAVLDGEPAPEIGPPGHFLQGPDTPRLVEPGAPSAYLKIGDGCSRRCAFCAIPSIRGRAASRPIPEIVEEASRLAARGARELVLVAQDVSAFGSGSGADLADLLGALDGVEGVRWLRLLYLYPDAVSDRLLEAVRDLGSTVPYLDVPIQHASAAMLRRMRRGHGPEALESLIDRARAAVPGVFLRTGVLVGHPGETEREFADLAAFLERARFDHLGAFRYSPEEGTASFGAAGDVSRRDSYNRQRKVMAIGRRASRDRNRAMVDSVVEVLVEGAADEEGYVLVGRHAGQAPEIDGVTYLVSCTARAGDMVVARVVRAGDFDLVAEPA